MKQALLEGDMEYLVSQAVEQADAGAQILDVNVGLPGIDEAETMRRAVTAISGAVTLPLQIDSSNPEAIEAGLRAAPGKCLINSVNASQASLDAILPLAKKYGVEAEVIYQDAVPPVADYHAAPFKLLEETMAKVYPGYDVCPYIMTGGTDARFYKEVTDNALRFAPLEINHQQHASIHAAAENLSVLALPPAVDFYKQLLESYCTLEEGRRPEAKKPAARRAV